MSDLENIINNELRWRESEIAILKINLIKEYNNDVRFQCLFRCFVAITYAHYEGFLKTIFAHAFIHIKNSTYRPSSYKDLAKRAIFGKSLRKYLTTLSNDEMISETLKGDCIDRMEYPSEQYIFEISNLNQSNLMDLMSTSSIHWEKFSEYRTHVGKIVDLRHKCAHGEKISFDQTKSNKDIAKDIFSTQNEILNLMHDVALELLTVINEEKFASQREPAFLIA
jgi:hypothetical protein